MVVANSVNKELNDLINIPAMRQPDQGESCICKFQTLYMCAVHMASASVFASRNCSEALRISAIFFASTHLIEVVVLLLRLLGVGGSRPQSNILYNLQDLYKLIHSHKTSDSKTDSVRRVGQLEVLVQEAAAVPHQNLFRR